MSIFCTILKKAVTNCSPLRNVLSMILKLEMLPEGHIEEASVTAPSTYSLPSRNVPSVMFKLERLLEEHTPSAYPK